MIAVLVAAIVTGCATAVISVLIPRIESWMTRKRLHEAHRNTTKEEA